MFGLFGFCRSDFYALFLFLFEHTLKLPFLSQNVAINFVYITSLLKARFPMNSFLVLGNDVCTQMTSEA